MIGGLRILSSSHPFIGVVVAASIIGERLGDAVHLIVVTRLREAQQFTLQFCQERRVFRKPYAPSGKFPLLNVEPANFVMIDLDGVDIAISFLPKFLRQGSARRS